MLKNKTLLQGFEWDLPSDGKHWTNLMKKAPSLRRMGINAIWLPPAYKGSAGSNDVGYGVYDPYDLGEFDQKGSVRTKYGTMCQYLWAVRILNAFGIDTLADMVMNHRMGADKKEEILTHTVNPGNRFEVSPDAKNTTIYSKFTFPGRNGKYSKYKWDHNSFTSADYAENDKDNHLFLFDGRQFAEDVDGELGNYDYLMGLDVDVNNPAVKKELIRWGLWYLKKTHVRGFRLDAVKHISASFMNDWISALRETTGKELYTVGEYWSYNIDSLMGYIEKTDGQISLFDAPLHQKFYDISHNDGSYDMGSLWNDTLTGRAEQLSVTFVDNHDTQPGQSLQSFVDGWFKPIAYGLILLRGYGTPCVFWGDLYGLPNAQIPPVEDLPELLRLRRRNAYGKTFDYFDHHSIVGFTRKGSPNRHHSGLAFLCSNNGDGEKRMFVGKHAIGTKYTCVIGGHPDVIIDSEGFGLFKVSDRSYSVYVPKRMMLPRMKRISVRKHTK